MTLSSRYPVMALSFSQLMRLCGRLGVCDTACPLCGPERRSPQNRRRKVLRIWHDAPGLVSYCCVRCGEHGWAREDGALSIEPVELKLLRKEEPERDREYEQRQLEKALWLWRCRQPVETSLAETYLRAIRCYRGSLPATLGFLPASKPEHHPAMIAAFGISDELEPGVLAIRDDQVHGVHLTLLKPDGSGKAGTDRDKLMVGASSGSPIVLAPMNDLLGLVISEGIEDALSLHEATGLGAWAAGSASRIPALADAVPQYCESITVAADDDAAGKAAAGAFLEAMEPLGMCVGIILPNRRTA